ncbi:MAG TPA: hypothetical protein DD618_00490 [Acholeplasmatales bacterium]|nr:hypothetical protein [Acholeplasmatales bacterium]
MRIKDLKEQLRHESGLFVPDLKDQILRTVPRSNQPTLQAKRRFGWHLKGALQFSLSLLLIAIVALAFIGFPKDEEAFENTYVSLDINPSMEFEADEGNLVVSYRAMNVDAEFLLEENDLELIGLPLDDAVESVIGLAVEYGYLDAADTQGAVMITVVNRNQTREDVIRGMIETQTGAFLNASEMQTQLIVANATSEIRKQASDLDLSVGKMLLIEKARGADANLTIAAAKELSVKELNEIIVGYNQEVIEGFRAEYHSKVETLDEIKETALTSLSSREEGIKADISALWIMVQNREPLENIRQRTEELLVPDLPGLNVDALDSYYRYGVFLTELSEQISEKAEMTRNMINVKYQNQIKAFRYQLQSDLKEDQPNFEFAFDEEFEFDFFLDGEASPDSDTETEILRIISEVDTLMAVIQMNPRGQHERVRDKIDRLMDRYAVLMASADTDEDFRTSSRISEFNARYQNYSNNR